MLAIFWLMIAKTVRWGQRKSPASRSQREAGLFLGLKRQEPR
jgi:hypothetical protein